VTPKVFVSSTIRDLADLRSAVRFFLEQYGFEAYTSETPDFPHDLDVETRSAALRPIEDVDYFVLLLGFRAGSITPDGVPVTRSEFRRARELHREFGRPRLVLLAREQVLVDVRRKDAPAHPDVDDWQHVVDFVNEAGTAADPRDSNWLHPFNSFADVATVLRTSLRITGPLRRLALESNLREELAANAERLLMRIRDVTVPVVEILNPALVPPPSDGDALIDKHGTARIWMFRFGLPAPGALGTIALADSIASGEFLDFDPAIGWMQASPAQTAMVVLRQRIARYETLLEMVSGGPYLRELATLRGDRPDDYAPVSEEFRTLLYALRDEVANIAALTKALLRFLHGLDVAVTPTVINPPSPLPQEAERIEQATVTRDLALAWALSATPTAR
jgi:hypothetical protein